MFTTTRPDGRTNAEVLIALVEHADPGHIYPYDELVPVLAEGTGREWDRRAVQCAIRAANPRILRQVQRLLQVLPGVGYRLSHGSDHSRLALARERKSSTQLRAAVGVLRNVRWSELTPEQRAIHEAHLTVTAAVCAQVTALQRRQAKHDDVITQLLARVERLETQP